MALAVEVWTAVVERRLTLPSCCLEGEVLVEC